MESRLCLMSEQRSSDDVTIESCTSLHPPHIPDIPAIADITLLLCDIMISCYDSSTISMALIWTDLHLQVSCSHIQLIDISTQQAIIEQLVFG